MLLFWTPGSPHHRPCLSLSSADTVASCTSWCLNLPFSLQPGAVRASVATVWTLGCLCITLSLALTTLDRLRLSCCTQGQDTLLSTCGPCGPWLQEDLSWHPPSLIGGSVSSLWGQCPSPSRSSATVTCRLWLSNYSLSSRGFCYHVHQLFLLMAVILLYGQAYAVGAQLVSGDAEQVPFPLFLLRLNGCQGKTCEVTLRSAKHSFWE